MTYVSTILADGAVGFWELAEPSGTTATDAKGNQNGTYTNTGGIALAQTGIPGGGGATAAKFTPGTGYVAIADAASQHVGDTFSIEWWHKVGATGAAYGIFSSGTASSCMIETNSANPPIIVCSKVSVQTICLSSIGIPNDGNFHHCVWTKATSTNHLYIDGTDVVASVTNSACSNTGTGYNIARKSVSANEPANATFAMVALYPTALSSGTVSSHYTLGSTSASTSIHGPGFLFGFH